MKEKWQTLEHNGVLFPPEYEYKRLPVVAEGIKYVLAAEAEEMIWAWVQKLDTPYVQDKIFRSNFWRDLKERLPAALKKSKLQDWDLSEFTSAAEKRRSALANMTPAQKKVVKLLREATRKNIGYATIDGKRVPLAGYLIEPPGLFMGRGDHPLRGRWKPRVRPEHVTLNLSKGAAVPDLKGHNRRGQWLRIVENKNALWTAMWIDRLTGRQKRINFGAASFVKQDSDKKKFAKAAELANNFERVDQFIESKLNSKDPITRQLATACNLIAKLSIRVGDEKDGETESDTVGASTLRVENVVLDTDTAVFDFLGKDSIRYHNTVRFNEPMVRNLKELTAGKAKGEPIFHKITSHDVNEFLGITLPGLTAKQFRTATGSVLLAQELKEGKVDAADGTAKKMKAFTEANLQVALKLNHQSAVTKAYDGSIKTLRERLKFLKDELRMMKAAFKRDEEDAKVTLAEMIEYAKDCRKGKRQKETIANAKRHFKCKVEAHEAKFEGLKARITDLATKLELKEKTKGVALGTSRLNYADPRIVVSWCKDKSFPLDRIYTKSVQEKFGWALDVEGDFYRRYPDVREGED